MESIDADAANVEARLVAVDLDIREQTRRIADQIIVVREARRLLEEAQLDDRPLVSVEKLKDDFELERHLLSEMEIEKHGLIREKEQLLRTQEKLVDLRMAYINRTSAEKTRGL
ncbi:hypothetical protein HDU96_006471 [Phlyctochytrium bullatum]|nr:hypothetical protein HDU96_006471 [Phlyctochytrium bullatum]